MSRLRLGVIALMASSVLSGCMSTAPKLSPEQQTSLDTPLYCANEAECRLMWERAAYYISTHSRWQVNVMNNSVIETVNVPDTYYGLGYSFAREPMGGERYRIEVRAWCGVERYRCRPHADEGVARAKHYLRTGER